jgi:cytochrome c-type biogenesis protein CcmH
VSPQFLVLFAVLAFVAALWSYMSLTATRQETLDQHVYRVASQLKCPICQGESVADSTAGLSQEMRGIIRQKIQAGESDQQIIQFFVDRYGTQILWSPPWWGFSSLAWFVPVLLLLFGLGIVAMTLRNWRAASRPAYATTSTREKRTSSTVNEEMSGENDEDLAHYRAQLERELIEDDVLFQHTTPREEMGSL